MTTKSMTTNNEIRSICDRTLEMIHGGEIHNGMEHLHTALNNIRHQSPDRRLTAAEIAQHPLCDAIHQDPLTFHAFAKPRGYAGDAELLDYIYKIAEPSLASDHADGVYRYNVETGACRSVRARRQILADYIDRAGAGLLCDSVNSRE